MSNNESTGKIPVIPGDVSVQMELTPVFMQRIQLLISYMVNMYGTEQFVQFVKRIQEEDGKPETELEEHIQTISALMHEFEVNARDQGKIKWLTPEEASEKLKNNPLISPILTKINES